MSFQISFKMSKSVSIHIGGSLTLTCLQPASVTLMATHLLNSSWKASTLSGLTVNSTQSLNQCSEKSKVIHVNYILYGRTSIVEGITYAA